MTSRRIIALFFAISILLVVIFAEGALYIKKYGSQTQGTIFSDGLSLATKIESLLFPHQKSSTMVTSNPGIFFGPIPSVVDTQEFRFVFFIYSKFVNHSTIRDHVSSGRTAADAFSNNHTGPWFFGGFIQLDRRN